MTCAFIVAKMATRILLPRYQHKSESIKILICAEKCCTIGMHVTIGLAAKVAIKKKVNFGMLSNGLSCSGFGTLTAPGHCQHSALSVDCQFHQIS